MLKRPSQRCLQVGDVKSADSYVRGTASVDEKTPQWIASDFFTPYEPLQR